MSHYNIKRNNGRGRQSTNSFRPTRSRGPKKDYIHPSKFIRQAQPKTENIFTPIHKFSDFKVNPIIQNNLKNAGFLTPSPIQDQAIPVGLDGKDIVGIANTGTGKTAAFLIPVIEKLLADKNSKAIILAPTRELAQQIEDQCRIIAKGSGLIGSLLIGGVSMGPQFRELSHNPQIIIGTPGRIKDHLERKTLNLDKCNIIVLDEVDRMLDMGFVVDIKHILSQTKDVKQSFYFSATLDNRVKTIIDSFSTNPVQISVKSNETSDNIDQNIINFRSTDEKIDKLHNLLIKESTVKTLVFDDTQRSVEKLAKELESRGFITDSIHGGKSQSQRDRVLKKFKNSDINILVATDVAARGLDVSDITHVVNYSSPTTYEDYVHRIGRTGRAGKVGYALTFVQS